MRSWCRVLAELKVIVSFMSQRILLRVTKLKYLLIVLDRQIGRESKKLKMKLDLILQQLRSHFEKL